MPKNKHAIPDDLWERIKPFIPPRENKHPRGGGRKPKDDRLVFEAILFVLRYGCQWNALNATGLCPSSTVHDRFKKWLASGMFHALWEEGLLGFDNATKGIDWSWLYPNGGMPKPKMLESALRMKSSRLRRQRQQQALLAQSMQYISSVAGQEK